MKTIINCFKKPGEFRRGYVAATGAVSQSLISGLVHGSALHLWAVVFAWLTFGGVVLLKNDKPTTA